ncbi:MAG: hypothetical protein GTO33_13645 [Acidobacteria bacterium]|nr:hypothetical protein [Acidobacteriota bacterium]
MPDLGGAEPAAQGDPILGENDPAREFAAAAAAPPRRLPCRHERRLAGCSTIRDRMSWTGRLGAIWGAAGVIGMISMAIARIFPRAVSAYETGLTATQWTATAVFMVFMAYAEGYRGFQRSFSPRTAARVRYLRDRPNLVRSLFAPLFAMGFFHANRRTLVVAYGLTSAIVLLVLLIRQIGQPWRGIIAGGVVLGLSWGCVSLVACVRAALTREEYPVSPEIT